MGGFDQLMPDIYGSYIRGQEHGKQTNLEKLGAQYFAQGSSPQLLAQIAANGGNAMAYQQADRVSHEDEVKQLAQFGRAFLAAPPEQQAAMYPKLSQGLQKVLGLPQVPPYDPAHVENLAKVVDALDGGQNSELPSDARSAIFFQQHPDLLKQEQERYKNRPFYNPTDNTLVYPKGQPEAPPLPPPPTMPQSGSLVLDDTTLKSLLSVPAAERPTMLAAMQADAKGQPFDLIPGAGGQPMPAPGGPAAVRVGPGAADRASAVTNAQESAKYNVDQQRAAFDAEQAARVAGATAEGKARAENLVAAQADLPQAIATGNDALKTINEMLLHPGRKAATGASSKFDPMNKVPGTPGYDFNALAAKLKGKAFLQAFQSLKGSGQITEVEGQKATDAIAALDTAQSEEQYAKGLRDLGDVIRAGVNRARVKAGKAPIPIVPRHPPAHIDSLVEKYLGNP